MRCRICHLSENLPMVTEPNKYCPRQHNEREKQDESFLASYRVLVNSLSLWPLCLWWRIDRCRLSSRPKIWPGNFTLMCLRRIITSRSPDEANCAGSFGGFINGSYLSRTRRVCPNDSNSWAVSIRTTKIEMRTYSTHCTTNGGWNGQPSDRQGREKTTRRTTQNTKAKTVQDGLIKPVLLHALLITTIEFWREFSTLRY